GTGRAPHAMRRVKRISSPACEVGTLAPKSTRRETEEIAGRERTNRRLLKYCVGRGVVMRRLSVDSAVVFLALLIIAPVAGGQTHLHITTGYGDMEQVMTVLENILTEFQKDYPELTYDIEYIGGGHLVGQIPVRT